MESVLQARILVQTYISSYVGGLVETLTIDSPHIRKLDNTIFAVWNMNFMPPRNLFPFLIIRRFYVNDLLCIGYFEPGISRFETYVVPPPGFSNEIPAIDPKLFWPFGQKVDNFSCITIRKNNQLRHFSENKNLFNKHYRYDANSKMFLLSKNYYLDIVDKILLDN